jgi:hypothetical protein
LILLPLSSSLAQQKESFDLATFTVPKDWKNVSGTADVVSYAVTNNQKGTYRQIGIFRSTNSRGSVQADFQGEWQDLIVKTHKTTTPAALTPAASRNGWDAQSGAAPFDFSGGQSVAMLVTMNGYARCMSIVILTNAESYQRQIESFLESVELEVPAAESTSTTSRLQSAVQSNGSAPPVKNDFTFTSTSFDDG